MSEKCAVVTRDFPAVRILRRSARIEARSFGSVGLVSPEARITARNLEGPVRIFGSSFEPLAPEILTGPVATPDITSALIEWITSVPAYHQVRSREVGAASWSESSWTLAPSTSAAVTISPLAAEHTEHEYQVRSCLVGDGSAATDWTPAAPDTFYTLCYIFSYDSFLTGKNFFGTAYIYWETATPTTTQSRWKIYGNTIWNNGTNNFNYTTAHTSTFIGMDMTPGRKYEVQVYGENQCGWSPGWSGTIVLLVDPTGTPQIDSLP